ncbi:MAG: hypothetical protein V5804_09200 [Mucilaginibacter sp.]|uniref:hypothetical protein n=1 Tax=Mucilaginibacter sp. TaxID=1882438 RepID=UPI0034E55E7E
MVKEALSESRAVLSFRQKGEILFQQQKLGGKRSIVLIALKKVSPLVEMTKTA